MSRIRWGVLSTAKIGTAKVIPALQKSELGEVVAIASRDRDRAQAAAERLAIPRAHGSYEELLDDPDVDAVYNPLPNHLHVPWSIKALEAGNHVLCEKPIGLSAAEAEELVEAGRKHPQLKLMEAFMYRHHPQWRKTHELVRGDRIGELRTIQTFFSFFNEDPQNIRHRPEWGGGALMDLGCYPISLSRWLFDAEPVRAFGHLEIDPRFGVDRLVTGVLQFPGGGTSAFTASMQIAPYQRVHVVGRSGRIEIEIPFNAPPEGPCRVRHQSETGIEEITFEPCDQYTIQGDLFARSILDNVPVPTPIEDALANMRVIEAVVESSARGGVLELSDSISEQE